MEKAVNFEKYTQFFYESCEGKILRPHGKGQSFAFKAEPKKSVSYRLFAAGLKVQQDIIRLIGDITL